MVKDLGLPIESTALCSLHSPERHDDIRMMFAVAVCYGEGVEAELVTKGNFGCVSFEGKRDE